MHPSDNTQIGVYIYYSRASVMVILIAATDKFHLFLDLSLHLSRPLCLFLFILFHKILIFEYFPLNQILHNL